MTAQSVNRGAVNSYAPWTPAEDAIVRHGYTVSVAAVMAALPHRGKHAVYHRAQRLGVIRNRRWTDHDDARLRFLWDGGNSLDEIAAQLKRTSLTTYWRAQKIGLPLGCPHGWELISYAAKRTGYEAGQMRRILQAAGATIRRAITEPGRCKRKPITKRKGRLRFIVATGEVDAAVAAWLDTEPVSAAARRLGMCDATLIKKLKLAGVERRRPRGKPVKNARPHWRVSPDEIARALAYKPPKKVRQRGRHGWFSGGPMLPVDEAPSQPPLRIEDFATARRHQEAA